jgi:hypothetical protein
MLVFSGVDDGGTPVIFPTIEGFGDGRGLVVGGGVAVQRVGGGQGQRGWRRKKLLLTGCAEEIEAIDGRAEEDEAESPAEEEG